MPPGTGQGASSQSMPPGGRAPVIYPTMPCQGKKKDHYEWDGEAWMRETTKSAFFLRVDPAAPADARERVFVIASNDPNCPSRSVLEDIVSW
jgi:hypothetical protein